MKIQLSPSLTLGKARKVTERLKDLDLPMTIEVAELPYNLEFRLLDATELTNADRNAVLTVMYNEFPATTTPKPPIDNSAAKDAVSSIESHHAWAMEHLKVMAEAIEDLKKKLP